VFAVNIPTDTAALLASTSLPPPFGSANDTLISAGEMEQLTRGVGSLPQAPWQLHARPPRWGLGRYNRIEGLALGAKGELDLGRLALDGTGRIATTDATLDLQGGVLRETGNTRFRLGGYYRLAAVDPTARSLGIGNSLNALVLGRDDGDYFRATGAELTVIPPVTLPQTFSVRLYVERQRRAIKRTDFSIPNLINDINVFRPNISADSADQFGASVTFRAQRGIDPERTTVTSDVTIDAATGTFDFGRASTTLRVTAPSACGSRAPSSWPAEYRRTSPDPEPLVHRRPRHAARLRRRRDDRRRVWRARAEPAIAARGAGRQPDVARVISASACRLRSACQVWA
jgi:hypothetical protein